MELPSTEKEVVPEVLESTGGTSLSPLGILVNPKADPTVFGIPLAFTIHS